MEGAHFFLNHCLDKKKRCEQNPHNGRHADTNTSRSRGRRSVCGTLMSHGDDEEPSKVRQARNLKGKKTAKCNRKSEETVDFQSQFVQIN